MFGAATAAQAVQDAQTALAHATALSGALLQGRNAARSAAARLSFLACDLSDARQKADDAGKRRPKVLAAQGIYLSEGAPLAASGKVAFLFPGQGSQYVGMLHDLARDYPIVADTFGEADGILAPLIGCRLTDIVWAKDADAEAADLRLRETQNCQPAMLAADVAMLRLLQSHGVVADMVAGHSLGEYAAAVAAGVLSFADALYAVSARGREMAHVKVADNGKMAMVAADCPKVQAVLDQLDGYIIAANKNCHTQTVIAGNSVVVEEAIQRFAAQGIEARQIPVSHAFHCSIVAPAAEPLSRVLAGLRIQAPRVPILSNVDASYYPADRSKIIELMAKQLAAPVEFISQVERMYADGARIFIEVGPRRAITGFVRNILGNREHRALASNHPKKSGTECFQELLAALVNDGLAVRFEGDAALPAMEAVATPNTVHALHTAAPVDTVAPRLVIPVVISGVAVALPVASPVGNVHDDLVGRLLAGENFIAPLETETRQAMLDKNVVRLDKAGGAFTPLKQVSEVIQLVARFGALDLREFGVDPALIDALDSTAMWSIAVGIDALRDAGLPLVRRYRTTSTGSLLADRWALPAGIAERTGVILAAAFPGMDRMIETVSQQAAAQAARRSADEIETWVNSMLAQVTDVTVAQQLRASAQARAEALRTEAGMYSFSRKFLFRVLSLGHAQLAQIILAQGPNTQINAACASGTQAIGMARDWIQLGRCDRVVVVTADDVTSATNLEWFGAGFLAAGAATVEAKVEQAAVPFGAERNGMILGAGATGFVVESEAALAARGIEPIAEIVAAKFGNSAFHGTRLDAEYIKTFMADVVDEMSASTGHSRAQLAKRMFFMSHETYTPARGGSSAAEVEGLRHVFGADMAHLLVANTKGYTGHPMAATIEDLVAVKGLQRQTLPAVANLRNIDPKFADLHFANGGAIDADYALRFGAGFGSQVAMAAYKRRATHEGRLVDADLYCAWLRQHSHGPAQGLEIVNRTLRVAEQGGVPVWELGVVSLTAPNAQPTAAATAPRATANVAAKPSRNVIIAELVQLFAKHTGYDAADLAPEHDLEAELGVDTVKQAEIFSLVRERYSLARAENFKLSEVQSIAAIADYVLASMPVPETAPSAPLPVAGAPVAAPAIVPEAVGPASTAVASISSRDALVDSLRQIFAEHTGYAPAELDPNHALEADLGIDTVKQAEIFALVRSRYNLPKDEKFRLSDVQTLQAIADYVLTQVPAAPAPVAQAIPDQAAPSAASASPSRDALLAELTTLFATHTGYDVADLHPSHQLEADLGIDTVKQAEIFGLLRKQYGMPKDEAFKLSDVQTLNAIADYVLLQLARQPSAAPSVAHPAMPSDDASRPQAPVTTNVDAACDPARRSVAGAVNRRADGPVCDPYRLHDRRPASAARTRSRFGH